jgi:glycosyltransferase involved in cell wall biosynthesis
MRIAWRHYSFPTEAGYARGYLSSAFYIHDALKRAGVQIEDAHPDHAPQSRAVVHYCPPHMFVPYRGKKNILFSMWEGPKLPADMLPFFAGADAYIVPSRFCANVWGQADIIAHVAPLGLHAAYRSCDANRDRITHGGRRLRFLFVGSNSRRKGWQLLAPAWAKAFSLDPTTRVELYVKTIGAPGQRDYRMWMDSRELTAEEAEPLSQVIIADRRDLDPQALLEVYRSADVFIFPTYGEGFGLPALEAMATGCLVVAPMVGGMTEFVSPHTAYVLQRSRTVVARYGEVFTTEVPTPDDLAETLKGIAKAWGSDELELIRHTGVAHARTFTWENTAGVVRRVAEQLTYNGLQAIAPARPIVEGA